MVADKVFEVIAKHPFQKREAEYIEAIINRPQFVARVNHAIEEYIHKFILPEILYGTEIKPEEVDEFFIQKAKETPPNDSESQNGGEA